jgi:hypothetical protein
MPRSEPGFWFWSTRGLGMGSARVPDVIGALVGAASWLTAAHRRASPHLTGRLPLIGIGSTKRRDQLIANRARFGRRLLGTQAAPRDVIAINEF